VARRVVVGNHKGGSGKTAATVNLAAALAEAGKRVLVVDLDPQANASRRLAAGFDPAHPVLTTSEVLKDGSEGVAVQAIRPCGWPQPYADLIDVIPARYDLENRIAEAGTVGASLRLRRALDGADAGHDYTLMDCPPSLGHLTQNALAAAAFALGTVEPEFDSVEGALRYRDFIATKANREALGNLDLRLIGWIVSRVRVGVGAHAFQLDGLADTFGLPMVWMPHVPERAAVKDAADAALPLRALNTTPGRQMAGLFTDLGDRLQAAAA
jgi:chromosome partitioning protein